MYPGLVYFIHTQDCDGEKRPVCACEMWNLIADGCRFMRMR